VRTRRLAGGLPWLLVLMLAAAPTGAGSPLPEAEAAGLLQRYAASWDLDALLAEPPVAHELQALPAEAREQLLRNLSVRGTIDVYGGALSIMGNAPHRGGEDEALLCVEVGGGAVRLHVAILSAGRVTIHTRGERYNYLPICVRDWVAVVSTGHHYRFRPPANLEMVRPPE
jgi:hypothetical protein